MRVTPPNYTQTPNVVFDEILPQITSLAELKVTMAIIRQTFGWQKAEDRISLSQLESLTGLSRASVIEGIKLAMQRGTVGRRKVPQGYVYGMRVEPSPSKESIPPAESTSKESIPVLVKNLDPQLVKNLDPQKKDTKKERNTSKDSEESLSGEATATPPPSPLKQQGNSTEVKPMEMGQFANKELMERVAAARKNGRDIHSPTGTERKDFGAQFRQLANDGEEMKLLLLALDYQVAKASGDIEGEPKAWCGFRTALDRAKEGWANGKSTGGDDRPENPYSLESYLDWKDTKRMAKEAS